MGDPGERAKVAAMPGNVGFVLDDPAALSELPGPCRKADLAIRRHLGVVTMPFEQDQHAWMTPIGGEMVPTQRVGFGLPLNARDIYVPRYTASLDAAMGLLPRHPWLSWKIEAGCDGEGGAFAVVWSERDPEDMPGGRVSGVGATAAIALCVAALTARRRLEARG